MGLPIIEMPSIIFDADLPIMKEKVRFKPFIVENEKGFLSAGKCDDIKEVIRNYNEVIKPLLLTGPKIEEITSLIDYLYLCITLRCKSKDEMYSGKLKKCEHCGQPNIEFELNILDCLKFKNIDNVTESYKISDSIELKFVPVKKEFLFCAEKIKDEVDLYKYTIAHCIDMVIYNGEPYKDFTADEVCEKIVSKMTIGQMKDVFTKLSKLAQMHLEISIKCPNKNCRKETKIVENNFLKYLK